MAFNPPKDGPEPLAKGRKPKPPPKQATKADSQSTNDETTDDANASPAVRDGMTDEAKSEYYKFYLSEWSTLDSSERESVKSYDKFLITLSAGAFGLSVVFCKDMPRGNPVRSPDALVLAWFCFGVTLCTMLLSFLVSQCAWRRRMEILDQDYMKAMKSRKRFPLPKWRKRPLEKQNPFDFWTKCANYLALVAFLVGVGSFFVFASENFRQANHEGTMSKPTTGSQGNPSTNKGSSSRPSPQPPPPRPKGTKPK